jgi:hypothetical protein
MQSRPMSMKTTGCWHLRANATSSSTVAAGEVALIVCCIATESSEMATFVHPRSMAMADAEATKPNIISRRIHPKYEGFTMKMGRITAMVATHDRTENATGVSTWVKTYFVSSVLVTATKVRKLNAKMTSLLSSLGLSSLAFASLPMAAQLTVSLPTSATRPVGSLEKET